MVAAVLVGLVAWGVVWGSGRLRARYGDREDVMRWSGGGKDVAGWLCLLVGFVELVAARWWWPANGGVVRVAVVGLWVAWLVALWRLGRMAVRVARGRVPRADVRLRDGRRWAGVAAVVLVAGGGVVAARYAAPTPEGDRMFAAYQAAVYERLVAVVDAVEGRIEDPELARLVEAMRPDPALAKRVQRLVADWAVEDSRYFRERVAYTVSVADVLGQYPEVSADRFALATLADFGEGFLCCPFELSSSADELRRAADGDVVARAGALVDFRQAHCAADSVLALCEDLPDEVWQTLNLRGTEGDVSWAAIQAMQQ